MTDKPQKQQQLRFELAMLRARHDSGAVSPAVCQVVRQLETELAWSEQLRRLKSKARRD
jgi:hypothetical protein